MDQNRRQFFRIQYPPKSGPKLASGGQHFEVLDLSEQGLKFRIKSKVGYQPGANFAGSLTFIDGESLLIFGVIKRVTEDTLSIKLKKNIPLRIVMSEQRRLIQLFPKRA